MFNMSMGEMLLLAVIALVVLGPDKLPGAARTAGAMLRRLRRNWESIKADIERDIDVEGMREAAKEAADFADSVKGNTSSTLDRMKDELDKVRKEAGGEAASSSAKSSQAAVAVTATGAAAADGAEAAATGPDTVPEDDEPESENGVADEEDAVVAEPPDPRAGSVYMTDDEDEEVDDQPEPAVAVVDSGHDDDRQDKDAIRHEKAG